MSFVKWNYPTTVHFGAGVIERLPELLDELGIRKPLLCSDAGVLSAGVVDRVVHAAALNVEVFTDVLANPTGTCIEKGVRAYHAADCDGVIALGGGSPLDAGKAIALMVGQDRDLFDFEDVGDNHLRVKTSTMASVIAIPTTSGTGSEVGRSSVIVDETSQTKKIIFHANMMPAIALCDPALTYSLPAKLTAATGIDALSHCLEGYCANYFHPMADGIALVGMKKVFSSLERAVNEPNNEKARSDMMAASLMGATAFQKGLGAMHALAHPLGARLKAHHGLLNAIVMPYVLEFNRAEIEERMESAASFCGFPSSFDAFVSEVRRLRSALEIPDTLSAVGMTLDRVDEIAALAAVDAAGGGNPIALNVSHCQTLLQACLHA